MRKPRIRINRLQEEVIQAAYDWRVADVHHAVCVIGVRSDDLTETQERADRLLSILRLKIDNLHREEKSLGLI